MPKSRLALLTTAALITFLQSQASYAEEAADAGADAGDAIIVTGTRQIGRRAADSAAPIQVVASNAIQSVGQQDLTQVLAQNLPSLNFQSFGGDTANLKLSAALRGINPNDTLVLVNGKRRHFTSNLSVLGGSPYSGSATTDLSFIPTASIAQIEVLQDGAAAQYGSDAIAGVVNIILKNTDHGGTFSATGGQYYKGDGKTASSALNVGVKLGSRGFLNLTGEYRFHDYTQRGTYDVRYFNPDGTIKAGLPAINAAGVAANARYPYVNPIVGDARYTLWNVAFNAGYEIAPDVNAYAFGSYGNRTARANENYRPPNRVWGNPATVVGGVVVAGSTSAAGPNANFPFPTGFVPQISVREEDFSLTGGVKGQSAGWNWDASLTYGRNANALYQIDDVNVVLFRQQQAGSQQRLFPQTHSYDGTLINSEWSADLDLAREIDLGLAKPATLALGAQYRSGSYAIVAGEYSSYILGGTSSYPGFSPSDAGINGRKNVSAYLDLAVDPVAALHLDVAGRYEHYSEFGSVVSGKLTARYDFSPALAVRGTVSNGFRAPTLAEEYYSSTNVSPTSVFGQFPPNAASAKALGFSNLQPEKSTNFSFGLIAHPAPRLQLTIDAYQIRITNRILPSGSINGWNGTAVVSQPVLDALVGRGVIPDSTLATLGQYTSGVGLSLFTNGADTRTRGIEATADYTSDLGTLGKIDWTLGLNYNETVATRLAPLPAAIANGQSSLLTTSAISALTTATPKVKFIGNALWSVGPFSLNLRETIYGRTSYNYQAGAVITPVTIGTSAITDINVSYQTGAHLRFDLGANNLFNKQAPIVPTNINGVPADGGNVLARPSSYAPWGINGGYYYARVSVTF